MSSRNGQRFSDGQAYPRELSEGVREPYGEAEDYVDDFNEEYTQLVDGRMPRSQGVRDEHEMSYQETSFTEPSTSTNQNAAGSTVYAIRGSQMYRVDKVETPSVPREEPMYKYVKTTLPIIGDQKNCVPIQAPQENSQSTVYHMQQGPSVSYSYQTPTAAGFNAFSTSAVGRVDQTKTAPKTKRKHIAGQRKPCNCTKSMCLKLYCDCFANGEFCRDCNCKDCHNNMEYEADRTRAIKQSLERNPNAFKPKIGVTKSGQADIERLHQKGCHCKKSGCLKNYCECYEAKVPCTDRCKCKGCQNTEADRAVRFKDKLTSSALMNLANAASLTQTPQAVTNPGNATSDDESDNEQQEQSDPRAYPWFYMTDEVVEAATLCMVAQAEESLVKDDISSRDLEEMERLVLREFGRCLEQIIASAGSAA